MFSETYLHAAVCTECRYGLWLTSRHQVCYTLTASKQKYNRLLLTTVCLDKPMCSFSIFSFFLIPTFGFNTNVQQYKF